MKNDKPMFDVEDTENLTLINNSTESERLLKSRKTKKIIAKGNSAGGEKKQKFLASILVGLFVTIVGGTIVFLLGKYIL